MTKVFVYGTLLSGMERAPALAESSFLGHACISGAIYDLGSYPGLLEGSGQVYGEIYAVTAQLLEQLDSIEGYMPENHHASLYLRKTVNATRLGDGGSEEVFTYFFNHPMKLEQPIMCGDYRRYCIEQGLDDPWYLAYGSNLSSRRVTERVGAPLATQSGYLRGYSLRYTKRADGGGAYANLLYTGGESRCPVVAYRLTDSQLYELDRYEGEPTHYVRLGIPFQIAQDASHLGYVYLARPEYLTHEERPAESYLRHIREGYEEHGFALEELPVCVSES